MTVNLTPAQMAWLQAFATERGFATLDEAAQALIAEAMSGAPAGFEEPDAEWVIPLLDEAEFDIAEGRVVSHDEVKAHLERRILSLER